MTDTSSSSKAVYNAVPLLEPLLDSSEQAKQQPEETLAQQQAQAELSTLSSAQQQQQQPQPPHRSTAPFVFGVAIGMLCYCLVDSNWVPSLHLPNILVNSLATALLWSTITSAMAYGIFWSAWMVWETATGSSSSADDEEEEQDVGTFQYEDEDDSLAANHQEFFEHMEYYFTLGVFLGFCAACTIDVILFGIPLVGILSMVLVAFLWTLVMLKVAPSTTTTSSTSTEKQQPPSLPQQQSRGGTQLPMMVV
eukprot:CAMPEP_0168738208 /NCGR_PEP_ID=MMETSP0724-20121128/10809_1 /TAXON_ID=265536 /ORGANISM="Amphiprora sp., Strain CCMP467" /LENGTH=250 /DNA_ID=CAMNT_0008785533 /DNA_START=150 /DNA_END=902 /DNA_ORIENTATION=+